MFLPTRPGHPLQLSPSGPISTPLPILPVSALAYISLLAYMYRISRLHCLSAVLYPYALLPLYQGGCLVGNLLLVKTRCSSFHADQYDYLPVNIHTIVNYKGSQCLHIGADKYIQRLGLILMVFFLHEVTDTIVKVWCDNKKYLFLSPKKLQRVCPQRNHADILQAIREVQTSIPLASDFNHVCGHQYKRISDQLIGRPSQINIECDVMEELFVREEWKNNGSTREALSHEGMICKVSGRKLTGNIGKSVCD